MNEAALLYESVADAISGMITTGTLKPGERVPSVRRLSEQQRVSISTVIKAYEVLETQGLIVARPNAGFYVQRPARMAEEPRQSKPPTGPRLVGVSALVQELLDSRAKVEVNFGAACPSHELMPTQKLQRTLASVSRRHPTSLTRYVLPPGNEDLRRQIAKRALDFGCQFSAQDILITNGAMEALNLCLVW